VSPSAALEFALSGAQQDVGAGGLGEFFDPDSGAASGSVLAPVVERTQRLGASARWWPRDGVDLTLGVEHDWISNVAHVEGVDDQSWILRLGVRLRK
jgi:hypothetical protein